MNANPKTTGMGIRTGAQYLAGFMQLYGQGVKENRLAAMNMLRKAGKAGHAGVQRRGNCHGVSLSAGLPPGLRTALDQRL